MNPTINIHLIHHLIHQWTILPNLTYIFHFKIQHCTAAGRGKQPHNNRFDQCSAKYQQWNRFHKCPHPQRWQSPKLMSTQHVENAHKIGFGIATKSRQRVINYNSINPFSIISKVVKDIIMQHILHKKLRCSI